MVMQRWFIFWVVLFMVSINSAGKVSFYTKDGKFIKELKVATGSIVSVFQPFAEKFVGSSPALGENMSTKVTLNIYDSKLTKIKEIYQLIENEEEENWELHAHPIE